MNNDILNFDFLNRVDKMKLLEKYFEKMLRGSRLMVLAAVISSLLLSLLLFVVTATDVGTLLTHIGDF